MKTALLFAALFASLPAFADYSSDEPGKEVKCDSDLIIVTINAKRTEIRVGDKMDPDHPEVYKVAKHTGDGDTSITYIAKNDEARLTFSDRGDIFVAKGDRAPTKLRCP